MDTNGLVNLLCWKLAKEPCGAERAEQLPNRLGVNARTCAEGETKIVCSSRVLELDL